MRYDAMLSCVSLLVVLEACSATPPPVRSEPSEAEVNATAKASDSTSPAQSQEDQAAEAVARKVPVACETSDKFCLPPAAFVKRLCGGFHPDVALDLLAKGTPFTRGYLTRDTEAWNASGGASSSDKLLFDEEVLVLYRRAPDTGGMVVSGAGGGYDVLRWDGTCASLMTEEVRLKVPPQPRYASIPWKSLDLKTREALEADEKVKKIVADRRRECKGATIGSVSDKCEKVDKQMSTVIVEYIRNGGALPKIEMLP